MSPTPAQPDHTAGPASGLFGGGRRRQLEGDNARLQAEVDQLRAANEELRAANARLLGADPEQLRAGIGRLRADMAEARQTLAQLGQQIKAAQAHLVQTQEVAMLQEAGVYQYLHPLEDAVSYKGRLATLQDLTRSMVRNEQAVLATTHWTVNGSSREGMTMVRDFSKLMLRAYNAEADNCVRSVRPHRVNAMVDRLTKVRETIARLGKTMNIRIAEAFHDARVMEIKLTADYLGKVDEEKERVRAERERQREEERARREFEREKARLDALLAKELAHYQMVLPKLQAIGDTAGIAELEAKMQETKAARASVEARAANTRAGYVYVISNIGAFGADMIKIGMTRRLEPRDRIRELGDASVPFRFDTHALIFSEDAVGLESCLHAELADRKVNQINTQREFFYATPAEVRAIVERTAGPLLLEYHETPEASEWRASGQKVRAT